MDRCAKRRRINVPSIYVPPEIIGEIFTFMHPCDSVICSWVCSTWNLAWEIVCRRHNRKSLRRVFLRACRYDNIGVVKLLYGRVGVNVKDLAFQIACRKGYIGMAKLIHGNGGINVHACGDYAFKNACQNGHLDVAKRIYRLGGVKVNVIKWVLQRAYHKRHRDVENWLRLL